MNQVSMTVNPKNLIQSLKYSFTLKSTFLGELMQNARRAGATSVSFQFAPETQILRITDNGRGIESIEKLLAVAESGWDIETIADEHPFGIGFLSALFACTHITVVSKSGRISVNTADILSFKPISVEKVKDLEFTSITMVGVEVTQIEILEQLNKLAQGFPIPVIFNGAALQRPHALGTALTFIQTEIGHCHIGGFDNPGIDPCGGYHVYLQGLPIFTSGFGFHFHRNIVHLDSSKFFARLPDRDKLIDEDDVIRMVDEVYTAEIRKKLEGLKLMLTPEKFVEYYNIMSYRKLLSLLNDVPIVPRQLLEEYTDYPQHDSHVLSCEQLSSAIHRSEIESNAVIIVSADDDILLDGAAKYMLAWKKGYVFYRDGLDDGHWLLPMVRNLDREPVEIELINESHVARFQGEWVYIDVRFCSSYIIKVGNDSVEISGDAFYTGQDDSNEVICPANESTGDALKQTSSYNDSNGWYQQTVLDTDMDNFLSFLVANTSPDPAKAMERLLPNLSSCPSLFGKSFVISVDDAGQVTSVTAA